MQRLITKMTAAAVVLFAVTLLTAGTAAAKDKTKYSVEKLAQGKSYLQKTKSSVVSASGNRVVTTIYLFKVAAPSEGYLTVTVAKGTGSQILLRHYNEPGEDYDCEWEQSSGSKAVFIVPVSKGIYYFSADNGNTISYTFTKIQQKANYCRAKAAVLKKNKAETICQTPHYAFSRWYSLKLVKKQKISVYTDKEVTVSLLDENMQPVTEFQWKKNRYVSKKTLPKGRYFLKVSCEPSADSSYDQKYRLFTVKWK